MKESAVMEVGEFNLWRFVKAREKNLQRHGNSKKNRPSRATGAAVLT